jgi:2-methylcitrate dehydratase PrpD
MTATEAELSDAVCRHVAGQSYDRLPAATRHAAKRVLLDATGVMAAASGLSPECRPFVALARATGGGGPCTLLGHVDRLQPPMAAFANGAMAHALDFEDAFDRAPCHPNASAVPAALAIVQGYGPVHGRELVTAIAIGCDLVCRIALSLRRRLEDGGWFPPTLLGGIGAAAVAARLLRLPPRQIRDTLSLMLCQLTAPGAIRHSGQSEIRAVREAFPAQAAVLAALLARDGVAGFEQPLEGSDAFYRLYADNRYEPADVLDGLGDAFLIEQLSFKPWPACRGTHAYIEIALELRAQHSLAWTDIDSITVETGPVQQMLVTPLQQKQAPQTTIDARFSIPFMTALALVRGRVGLDDLRPESLADPDILALARRVAPALEPAWGMEHAVQGALSLRLKDGRCLSGRLEAPLGSLRAPISDEALTEKFVACWQQAAAPLPARAARELARRILEIDDSEDSGACFAFGDVL